MEKYLICIPADSRPVSRTLPRLIGEIGGCTVLMPPLRWTGGRDTPGDIENVQRWLLSRLRKNPSPLFVSADFLAFGGLVFSREPDSPLKTALARLNILARIKESFPNIPILAFQAIPRDAVTVRDLESFRLWKAMMEKGEIPARFAEMRKRNLKISHKLIEMAACGVFHTLVFAKEDVSPHSPFLEELEILRSEIKKKNLKNRVFVQTGADEILLLLLARYFCSKDGTAPRIYIHFSESEFFRRTPPYENVPFGQTIEAQATLTGAKIISSPKNCDVEIVPHFTDDTPVDIFLSQIKGRKRLAVNDTARKRTVETLSERLRSGALVALLDCAFLNGGDAALVKRLLANKLFFHLFSYSGWNTFANRTGSLLAHSAILWSTLHRAGKPPTGLYQKHLRCLFEHLLNDCVYSTVVRGSMLKFTDAAGNVLKPIEAKSALTREMKREIAKINRFYLNRSIKSASLSSSFLLQSVNLESADFPWGRIFEIHLKTKPVMSKFRN